MAEFIHQALQAFHKVFAAKLARTQIHDVGADVADGAFRPSMAWSILPWARARVFLIIHAGVIQRQPNGVDGLNDTIVQVHADAFALFEHCQAAGLLARRIFSIVIPAQVPMALSRLSSRWSRWHSLRVAIPITPITEPRATHGMQAMQRKAGFTTAWRR